MLIQQPDGTITVNEAAKKLGVTLRTMQRLIKDKKVESFKLVNKRVYVNLESLLAYGGGSNE